MAASIVYPMVNDVNSMLTEAVSYRDKKVLELGDSMQLYNNEKIGQMKKAKS